MKCKHCGHNQWIKSTSKQMTARGRLERWACTKCYKLRTEYLPDPLSTAHQGYLDIESTQAGRGAGNFGIVLSWCIGNREDDRFVGDYLDVSHDTIITKGIVKDEKRIIKSFCDHIRSYNHVFTWYGTGHDVPILRTRAEFHGLDFPKFGEVFHTDLYYSWRPKFKIHSNRQDAVDEFLGAPPQEWKLAPPVWIDAVFGNLKQRRKAIGHIWLHNVEDVWQTKRVHERIERYLGGTRRSM